MSEMGPTAQSSIESRWKLSRTAACCSRASKFSSQREEQRFVPWRPRSRAAARRESGDRKAHSLKRAVASIASTFFVALSLSAIAGAAMFRAQAQDSAPARTTDDLLRAVPFDRVTLIDGTTVLVDPVSPRPLPTYDPTKDRAKQRRR